MTVARSVCKCELLARSAHSFQASSTSHAMDPRDSRERHKLCIAKRARDALGPGCAVRAKEC